MSALPPLRVSCLSQKGGGGKTTIATNLAVAFAMNKVSTALFDLDAQQSSVRAWGTWRAQRSPKTPAPLVVQATGWDNLEARLSAAKAAKHKVVVLDTPGQKGMVSNFAASVSNIVLVAVQPSMLDLATLSETYGLENLNNRPAFVVFNRVPDQATAKSAREMIEPLGYKVAECSLSNLDAYREAAGEGLGVLEYEPAKQTAAAAKDLAKARREVSALHAFVVQQLAKYPKVAMATSDEPWGGMRT